MPTLLPLRRATWTSLLKQAAAWLVAVLLMQALQGAMALGAGPRHTHAANTRGAVHSHLHAGFERHHHRVDDATVQRSADDDTLDLAGAALAAALGLMLLGRAFARVCKTGHAWRDAPAWFWSDRSPAPLRRPPRLA